MFATYLAHREGWEKFAVSMWEGKFPKRGGNHDSKYKVTELSTVVSYFCCMSKKGKLLCSRHSFFLPPPVYYSLQGPHHD